MMGSSTRIDYGTTAAAFSVKYGASGLFLRAFRLIFDSSRLKTAVTC
jgi:hypothetical protein